MRYTSLASSAPLAVGRLAPSPTGAMHLGNARTALLAWLSVRSRNGRVVLRMEDLDAPRVVAHAAAGIIADFKQLGLDWDYGPDADGAAGPYVQSLRGAHYRAALATLQQQGQAFACSCSRADLARAPSAPHHGEDGPHYPGSCRGLTLEQVTNQATNRGKQVAWRFRSEPRTITFSDAMSGEITSGVDDFVLWRADGIPSYQLAVVVDDVAMGVTEVVRGDDLLSSTARQLCLYESFGSPPPEFAHVPLVLAPTQERLAKRHRPVSVAEILQRGVTPAALVGALAASAGLCPQGTHARPQDLVAGFSWRRLHPKAVVIDPMTLEAHAP